MTPEPPSDETPDPIGEGQPDGQAPAEIGPAAGPASEAEPSDRESADTGPESDLALESDALHSVQEAAEFFLPGRAIPDVPPIDLRQAMAEFLRWRSNDPRRFPILERYMTECTVAELRELIAEVVIAQEVAAALSGSSAPDEVLRRWARYPAWRLPWEAATLLSGGEPGAFKFPRSGSDRNRSFQDLVEQFERAVEIGDLKALARPATVVAWARRNKIAIPPAIASELSDVSQPATSEDGEEIENTRMRKNIGLIVLGMAKAKFSYDPRKARQSAPKEISRATLVEGKTALSPERVKHHLDEFVKEADLHERWDELGK